MPNTIQWESDQRSTCNFVFCIFPASVSLELLIEPEFSHNKYFFSHMNDIGFLKEALENYFVFVCFPICSLITE